MVRSKLAGVCLALGLLFAADKALAAPIHDGVEKDLIATITELLTPKAYRITGAGGLVDFVSYCVDSGLPIGDGVEVKVTGFDSSITPQTAYLYTQYRQGLIPPGYDIDNPLPFGPLRPDGLQEAIWCAEGDAGCNAAGSVLLAQANAAIAGGLWSGLGDVFQVNFVFNNHPVFHDSVAQPMLVLIDCETFPRPECFGREVPNGDVPEPGSMLLLGSGLVGIATAARRRWMRRG